MKFVIIGGDAAGMSAASRAKRTLPDMEVIVLEKTGDVSYSACGMPYNIADADRPMDDLVVRSADVFRKKQGIDVLTGYRAEAIDTKNRIVSGTSRHNREPFRFFYDRLLIATGGRAKIPALPGFDHPGVAALKSLKDGRAIKDFIRANPVRKVVIVGMGYIGLEMAEALRMRDLEVEMVKPGPALLPWMSRELASVVEQELHANQVRLHLGCNITAVEKTAGALQVVCDDRTLPADMVLAAIGIDPNSELAADAGIETGVGNAIAVNRRMQTSDENIYAAGDCADAYHVVTGQKTWIPLALRANRAGWTVADNVCGRPNRLEGVAGTAVFKVFGLEVARTGLSFEESQRFGFDPVDVTIQTRSRAHAHPGAETIWVNLIGDKKSGRLTGAQMVGREGVAHRINAAAVALHNRMSVRAFSQTDLAYAPPFGPVWDPLLTAANQLLKKMI
ncbi:NADH oxidase [Desulfosarcina alkanivorans]|jgi:NADPH-dependent 2,4-dienoyl-CoA reductase/sulfur reductase-like enzyme|uniref:NADH oxidase n=1 Tax=Desulfosarcina alkanivorans TaxID=571177 RepID=A0A5K7YPB7_9BACT|nr:FAD-dependent oxidoreductase [Desulfosarcina alkanivorans]BBO70165.1 NADH oxidase [Desulfosarcina alkanivorans]